MEELKDCSGPYVPDLQHENHSKDTLVKLLSAYSREVDVLFVH